MKVTRSPGHPLREYACCIPDENLVRMIQHEAEALMGEAALAYYALAQAAGDDLAEMESLFAHLAADVWREMIKTPQP